MIGYIIIAIIAILAFVYVVYYFATAFFSMTKPFRIYPESKQYHRYGIVIAARNEEKVIGNLIDSLKKQNYPSKYYSINVFCNNCSDHTKEVVLAHGARAIEVNDDVHTKGEVLEYAFRYLKSEKDDAYIVYDADNIVDENFLLEMNKAYDSGYRIIQGRRASKNGLQSVVTMWYEMFYLAQNIGYNHPKTIRGYSSSLNGTGCLVARSYIDEYGFSMHTITEDLELTGKAALENEPIGYVHSAITYDEYPDKVKITIRQLWRWIMGQIQCLRQYIKPSFKKLFHSRTVLDCFMIFAIPVEVMALIILGVLIFFVIPYYTVGHTWWLALVIILAIFYVGLEVFFSYAMYKSKMKIRSYWKGMLSFPVFLLLWLPIMFVCLFKKNVEWKPIRHDDNIPIEDMK